jgi:ribonuclease-3
LLATLLNIQKKEINKWTFDYKTFVQDKLIKYNNKKITYHTRQIDKNHFESILSFDKIIYGKGEGKNKKQAEKEAAKNAYNKLVTIKGSY